MSTELTNLDSTADHKDLTTVPSSSSSNKNQQRGRSDSTNSHKNDDGQTDGQINDFPPSQQQQQRLNRSRSPSKPKVTGLNNLALNNLALNNLQLDATTLGSSGPEAVKPALLRPSSALTRPPPSALPTSPGATTNVIFPDVEAPTINLTTNRSASHIFLRQKLATIRKINENNDIQAQNSLIPRSRSNLNGNQDAMQLYPISPTLSSTSIPTAENTRHRSSSQLFRQQHALNYAGMASLANVSNKLPPQSGLALNPSQQQQQNDNSSGLGGSSSMTRTGGGGGGSADGGDGQSTIHQAEFDFQYQDRDVKPMSQAEFDDIRKKKESSLDFSPSVNNIYMIDQFATTRTRRLCNGLFSWSAVVVICILTGMIGAALRIANTRVNNYKFSYAAEQLQKQNYGAAWGIYAAWNLAMLMCSTIIVLCFEIKANGSGIPDVKAYLNGCNIKGAFSTRTLVAKLISSALTINAGVPSGLQGPTIHLGAVTGAWVATWWKRIIMRVFCCARPFEELRNFKDIPRLPNPVSAKIYRQGYFQAVHEEQIGTANTLGGGGPGPIDDTIYPNITTTTTRNGSQLGNQQQQQRRQQLYNSHHHNHTIDSYTQNDLFLQASGVKLAPTPALTAPGNHYIKDKKGYIHILDNRERTDINQEGKPFLMLTGENGQLTPIIPAHIDNLTIDGDVVPTTNTARRKLAQCGVAIRAPTSQFDDNLATDFQKAVKNPEKFGAKVNANGGIFGFVIRDKRIRVEVAQPPEGFEPDQNTPRDQNNSQTNYIEDLRQTTTPRNSGHNRRSGGAGGGGDDSDSEDPDDMDFFEGDVEHSPVETQNAINIIDLDSESRRVATRCPRFWRSIHVPSFADDSARREYVSIGSGAGVAAAMGAIIGGLLFALEEMSTHWSPTLGLKVLAGSTISYLVVSFFAGGNNGVWGIFNSASSTYYVGNTTAPFRIEEIPLYVLLGIVCGLIGALYIFITMNIMRWRNAMWGPKIWPKFIDTAILCIIWSTVCLVVAFAWPCETISPIYAQIQASSGASAGTFGTNQFDCPAGFHNKFADLSFVRSDLTVKRLFARGYPDSFQLPELAGWAMLYFLFCAILQQTNASFGIVVPIFVMGCSWGRLFGKLVYGWWGYTATTAAGGSIVYFDPGIYAVVGCAAMFAAITRSTLSMTVVILEMTADLNLLAPALIAAFVSNLVASQFGPSIFMSIILERKLPYLSHDPPSELFRMTTKQIMIPKPTILGSCERVDHILAVLESSSHAGYPVVLEPCTAINAEGIDSHAHRGANCDNNFIGMILRSHLLIILNRRVWRAASTPFTLQDYERVLSRAMPKLGELRARLSAADLESYIDLTPWANRSSLLVPEHMLAAQAFVLFRSMGLRHIPVINGQKHITGVLTRLELLDRVVQHRWITLRKLEHQYMQQGGSSLAQQYVDANTAYSLVSAHALNSEIMQKVRAQKTSGYKSFHNDGSDLGSQRSNGSNLHEMLSGRPKSGTQHNHPLQSQGKLEKKASNQSNAGSDNNDPIIPGGNSSPSR